MQHSIAYIKKKLATLYPESEIESLTQLILEKKSGQSRIELFLNKNSVFSDSLHAEIQFIADKLAQHTPIQHILGEAEFYSLPFYVNRHVLIPRPETEELVDWIVKSHPDPSQKRLLDMGTGSGCIPISVQKHRPTWHTEGIDISEKALETAVKNGERNGVKTLFWRANMLNMPKMAQKWDIMVSNPPYVCESERVEMERHVLEFEPHEALFVPEEEPLRFYKAVVEFAKAHLAEKGELYFEINRIFGEESVALMRANGFTEVELRKDLSGNDRMVKGVWN